MDFFHHVTRWDQSDQSYLGYLRQLSRKKAINLRIANAPVTKKLFPFLLDVDPYQLWLGPVPSPKIINIRSSFGIVHLIPMASVNIIQLPLCLNMETENTTQVKRRVRKRVVVTIKLTVIITNFRYPIGVVPYRPNKSIVRNQLLRQPHLPPQHP